MADRERIILDEGQNGLSRTGTNEIYTLSEVPLYVRVSKLTYQRSFGDSEDSRLFGTGILDGDLYAFGQPDRKTPELSLTIRGSAEKTLGGLKGDKVLEKTSDQEIHEIVERFSKHMQWASLSYFPSNEYADSEAWFLEIVITKQAFDDLLETHQARRLSSLLICVDLVLLILEVVFMD